MSSQKSSLAARPSAAQQASPSGKPTPPERSARVQPKTQKQRLVTARHRQITDAAIVVFEAKGFHGATLRDIGTAAGVTQGTIYNYVRTKEDILFLVCDRIVTDYLAGIRAALKKFPDPKSQLKSAIRAIVQAMFDHRVEIGLIYREIKHLSPEAQEEIFARINQFLIEVEAAINSTGTPYDTRFACNMVTFLPAMFGLRSWVTPKRMSKKAQVDQMVRFMCEGLGLPVDDG